VAETADPIPGTGPFIEGPLESLRFSGLQAGPKLIVLGAVHGNEGCGPTAIARIIADCRTKRLVITRGEVTFVPVTNPKAFFWKTREGDRNLNRDLREKPLPTDHEDRVGNRLCGLLRQHDVLLDLHSFRGEGPPFVFFGPGSNHNAQAESAFAACLGTSILIHGWLDIYARLIAARGRLGLPPLSATEGFGTTEYMRFVGGYGVTLECGSHDDPAAADVGETAIRNALAHLGLVDAPAPAPKPHLIIHLVDLVLCEEPGDRLEGSWKTGDVVRAGALVARRAGGEPVLAPSEGYAIFPSAIAKPGESICYLGVASPPPTLSRKQLT
jgi:predicted deacylase